MHQLQCRVQTGFFPGCLVARVTRERLRVLSNTTILREISFFLSCTNAMSRCTCDEAELLVLFPHFVQPLLPDRLQGSHKPTKEQT